LIESKVIEIEAVDGTGDTVLVVNTAESMAKIFEKYGDQLIDSEVERFTRIQHETIKQ
jgi:hypothetical protein